MMPFADGSHQLPEPVVDRAARAASLQAGGGVDVRQAAGFPGFAPDRRPRAPVHEQATRRCTQSLGQAARRQARPRSLQMHPVATAQGRAPQSAKPGVTGLSPGTPRPA